MKVSISNQYLIAQINLKGAELFSLQNNSTKEEFIWEGNPNFWGKHSPILFPIVGTLKNNSFKHNNQKHELSRHGFARDLDFQIKNKTKSSVCFSLTSNEYTKSKYPFDFELLISYHLIDNELKIAYTIINNGNEIVPFSVGGHPAFSLNGKFENYALEFEVNETIKSYLLKEDLLSNEYEEIELKNKKLPLTYSLFENDAMIIKKMQSKEISILKDDIPILKFKFNDFPNFGIWTKVGAPFICLEPWVGYSDTFETSGNIFEKEGIQILEANSEKKYTFSITIL